MVIWAWFGAVLIGVTLGLLGSGGSILTVPTLIYLVEQDPKVAFASSLAIVGMISAVSAFIFARQGSIHWRSVGWFGIPGMIGAFASAHFAQYLDSSVQLFIFASLLLVAATLMFRPMKLNDEPHSHRAFWKIALDGLAVGSITGLVGVGGGFLIIPALVILGGLSMSVAVGTSLVIITMQSASGFVEYYHTLWVQNIALDWQVIFIFVILGIIGGRIGAKLNHHLPQQVVRRVFAVFLIAMGIFIFWQNWSTLAGVLS